MRKLGVLCIVLCTSLALGQNIGDQPATANPAGAGQTANTGQYNLPVNQPEQQAGGRNFDDAIPGVVSGLRADEPCPVDSIIGQAPGACGSTRWFFYTDLEFCSGTQCRRVRCDNWPKTGDPSLNPADPNDWIGVITWYGVYINDASQGCTKTGGHQFRIRFYPDANQPDPNGYNYEEFLTGTAVDTGETVDFGSGPAIRWFFTAVLTTPRQQARGFFSICGTGTPLCYHLWEGSGVGDNKFWNWFETNLPASYEMRTTFCDQNWCFGVKKIGACCFDCTGTCEENMAQNTCDALHGRFLQNQPCSALNPPCGAALGACCHDDGTCELTTCDACLPQGTPECNGDYNCDGIVDFADINPLVAVLNGETPCDPNNADCNDDGFIDFGDINCFVAQLGFVCPTARTQGNVWLGANTTCAQCCTIVPGTPTEGEPKCQDEYEDTFNGGCNSTPPVFSTITIGVPIYGEAGTYNYAGGNRRDTDWYAFTNSGDAILSATVEAEFDVNVAIYHAGDCDANSPNTYWTAASAQGLKCTQVTATSLACVPAGDYWVIVTPQFFDGVPCGADYKLTLNNPVGCTPCAITCTPTQTEAEACGQNYPVGTNGGCNDDPNNPFETLGPFTSAVQYTLCGSLWANNGSRDTDWYTFTLPIQGTIVWEFESEIPIITTPVFGSGNFDPPFCGGAMWGYWGAASTTPCVPPGNIVSVAPTDLFRGNTAYWWLVLPDNGEAIFEGFPCSIGQTDYRIAITYTQVECTDVCTGATFQEGEPPCGQGYVDTFNGGCDAATFAIQPAIAYVSSYCGRSGTWVDPNNQTKLDYDWWKIQLTGTVNKRLRINMRTEFNMILELYRIADPNNPCTTKQRLDYYEFSACAPSLNIYTRCLTPSATAYYALRVVPASTFACTDHNTYKFAVTVESETPACTTCTVTCSTTLDDPCQSAEGQPATNEGCNATPPTFMPLQVGNNVYGPIYCGRTSTFLDNGGGARVDLDWFEINMAAARTKLLIRGKAEFRMSINIALTCSDAGTTHGWDRACKGTTTPFVNTWTGLLPATQYYGVIIYGNGGGDGTGENPLVQFFSGLPCSETFNEWQLELQGQP
jgi:hypothetical protein